MVKYPLNLQTHTEGKYHHGWTQNSAESPQIPWIRLTDEAHARAFWFLYPVPEIFDQWGWERLDAKRYEELEFFFTNNWVSGINYLYCAVNQRPESFRQIMNWILGPVAEVLNEWDMDGTHLWDILHPNQLSELYNLMEVEGFIRSKSKDAVNALMHGVSTEVIANDEMYWAKDDGELDKMIQSVYEREKEKVLAGNPDRIANWLVGQIMKEARGKADPEQVRNKVQQLVKDVFNA